MSELRVGENPPAQPEQSESERSEPERSEPERSEPERSEPEQSKPEQSKPEGTQLEGTQPERSHTAKDTDPDITVYDPMADLDDGCDNESDVAEFANEIEPPAQVEPEALPYRTEVADRVPPYGMNGEKTTGVLDLGEGRVLEPQISGYEGPALRMPKPRVEMDGNLVTHVEAHSVAAMRFNDVKHAALYINKEPCQYPNRWGQPWGCAEALPSMLKPDESLTIYGPNGYHRVFHGRHQT